MKFVAAAKLPHLIARSNISTLPNPIISVVLPVYNCGEHLKDAVASVLNQSMTNFELIAIDDGSTDDSLAVLKDFEKKDSRVRVVSRENKGLVETLNEGIRLSRGEYIARMDGDDICRPERFEKQIQHLQNNPRLQIVGGHYQLINEFGEKKSNELVPLSSKEIFLNLVYSVPFAHPSVMAKKTFFATNNYGADEHFSAIEDLYLWQSAYSENSYGNVDDLILDYRVYKQSFSFSKRLKMYHRTNESGARFLDAHSDHFLEVIQSHETCHEKFLLRAVVFALLYSGNLRGPVLKWIACRPKYYFGVSRYLLRQMARYLYTLSLELKPS